MKVILISIGTRGDMEPFLAIGEILKEKGHQVICAFPEQFQALAKDSNLEFVSLGTEYIELLESDLGKAAMGGGGSGLNKFIANIKLATYQTPINKAMIFKQYEIIESEKPDRILYNAKVSYPIIWGLNNQGRHILVSALPYLHYVREHTHVIFNSNFGPFLNKLTYSLANFGMVTTTMITKRWLKIRKKISRKQIKNALLSNKVIYTISPALFSRPDYWKENLKVLGFHEKQKSIDWQSGKALNDFLEKHSGNRMLFITFGSMTNPDPEAKTRMFIDILERNKIPAIINTASGGLVRPDQFDADFIHFVSQIPYDRIFSKMYGVIHHGGSGTTHLALKYGCATMIIPHIIDQFVWDKIIFEKGAGPKGIKIGKITTKNLEPKILEFVSNNSFKKKAEQIEGQLAKEDFWAAIYETIIG